MTIEPLETVGSATVCSELLSDGWHEYPDQFKQYARCFYKRFDTPTRCHGNNDKPGVQIQISVSEHEGRASIELELRAGLKDETWIIIQNYALPNTVKQVTALIPRILAAWESANYAGERPGDPATRKERMNKPKLGADSVQRLIRPAIGKDTIIESVWYFVEVKVCDGTWHEVCPECETLKEARAEMVKANCWGHEARIVQHFHGYRPVRHKDFKV